MSIRTPRSGRLRLPALLTIAALAWSSSIAPVAAAQAQRQPSAQVTIPGQLLSVVEAEAEGDASELPELTLAELLPESQQFHPDVMRQVMPSSTRVSTLRTDLTLALVDRDDADGRRLDALARRSAGMQDRWAQRVIVDDRVAAEALAADHADSMFEELGVFAVDSFLGSEEVDLARLSLPGPTSPIPGLTDGAGLVMEERYEAARAGLEGARGSRIEAEDVAAEIDALIARAEADLEVAELDLADADERIADLRPQLEAALVDQMVPGTDLSLVVIDAYFRASVQMADRRPSCGITWDQLAGVGLIESRHGRFGGSEVGPDGQTSRQILGPVLDGEPFSAIADTDGGVMDGNTEWDRAVGPMQFIPSSWKIYGLDGNDDGEADPHNLYDAAYAAAEHLCRGHSNLQNDANYRQSLLGYNRSEVYGSDVMAARSQYRSAVSLRPTPEGVADDLAVRNSVSRSVDG